MSHSSTEVQTPIVGDFTRVEPALIDRARALAPSILADVAGRRGALNGRIRAVSRGVRMIGSALTVEVRPGDCLTIHIALALARPGDVLVIDGKGDLSAALMGGIMTSACRKIGVAGIVVDGAIRDSAEIVESGFPAFAAGTNPNGPSKDILGRIGHTVVVGGVAVKPGDLVVGDDDGVVAIDRQSVSALLPLGEAKVQEEAKRMAAIAAGDLFPKWLDRTMAELGLAAHMRLNVVSGRP